MSDQGITVSPEDRERLAKSKFGEWFDEFFDKKFEEAFDKKNKERKPGPTAVVREAQLVESAQHEDKAPTHQRKRSLLDIALSDTFGF